MGKNMKEENLVRAARKILATSEARKCEKPSLKAKLLKEKGFGAKVSALALHANPNSVKKWRAKEQVFLHGGRPPYLTAEEEELLKAFVVVCQEDHTPLTYPGIRQKVHLNFLK